MEARLAWLDEQLGIGEVGRLQRVVRLAPLVLLLSLEKTLRPRVAFVRALGVDDTLLANLLVRSPRLLHSPEAALAGPLFTPPALAAAGGVVPGADAGAAAATSAKADRPATRRAVARSSLCSSCANEASARSGSSDLASGRSDLASGRSDAAAARAAAAKAAVSAS